MSSLPLGRELQALPIAPSLAGALVRSGFRTVRDLALLPAATGAAELSRSLKLAVGSDAERALAELLETVRGGGGAAASSSSPPPPAPSSAAAAREATKALAAAAVGGGCFGGQSAFELYEAARRRRSIITFCSKLDSMLGGGVALGEVTEFCGVPGVGKTQISMQLALDVQIPAPFGGVGGEALYVDTEGSFTVERAREMAVALARHLRKMAHQRKSAAMSAAAAATTWESLLAGIRCARCTDYAQLLALVRRLPTLLDEPAGGAGRVKLLVVDSIAFHFRHGFADPAVRARLLMAAAQALNELAQERGIAVVLVNQVTTSSSDFGGGGGGGGGSGGGGGGGGGSTLKPALGESWSHSASNRVMLSWRDGGRWAELVKSTCHATAAVPYEVNESGVRDCKLAKDRAKKQKQQQQQQQQQQQRAPKLPRHF